MTVFDKLSEQNNFTDTEKRIADFILANESDMPSMTVNLISKRTFSSHSAVIRLTKKLGFDGFKDFRVELIKEIQNNLNNGEQVDPNFPFGKHDDAYDIAKKMAYLSMDAIQKTLQKLDKSILEDVTNSLARAQRIFLFGIGDSQIRARSFKNKFTKINKDVVLADEYGESTWNSLNIEQEDCALFISYTGKSANFLPIAMYLCKKNIDTILITGNSKCQLTKFSKFTIEVPQGEVDHVKVGTFISQISFEYILDTLFSLVFAKNYENNLLTLNKKKEIVTLFDQQQSIIKGNNQ